MEKSFSKIGRREQRALEVLKNGGYFRRQLETQYRGGEKFVYRLRDASGRAVSGFGFQTFQRLRDVGALRSRSCQRSSVWPSEWELAS